MDSKTTSIVTYLTWIGFFVALATGTKDEFSVSHMNNALVCNLFCLTGFLAPIVMFIPFIGIILMGCVIFFLMFIGILVIISFVYACQGKTFELPLFGKIKLIKLPEE